ncbi:hypothetical protein Goari_009872, partial [Gossypium aridum]|nr:hypothetical protein [Gossypium aridum]
GTAKGIAYLHEKCQERIIHYDIKPGNILLDSKFYPKVVDFGLAKLINRENTHITMTRESTETCEIDEGNRETMERMVKTALWCVQYRPERRPLMSMVVKMLDEAAETP